ncbi:DNA polymerase III subunit beta [Thiocapsa marina]|uniref:Beta sliding clamp n=1 Tax=Thiocapsa marina 5811 TaxID=768671 RepID=F9UCD3_9GAMM|nr:DNA polymerase III subunit beta [Thiocapsa marina]EGV18046.1 DNA polymerase III, beta subunit [Thiocapsa marina 5811]
MELVVNRENLLPVLSKVVGVVERRQTLPILGNLLLSASDDRLDICGTDLEVEVKTSCNASVLREGETTLPARKLMDICRNLSEGTEIRFRQTNERCLVTAGRGRFTLGALPAPDFPLMDAEIDGVEVKVPERILREILEKTSFAMAQQDVRYYLNGLLVEWEHSGITAVGTDGHRLAKFHRALDLEIPEPVQVIVPSKTVLELRRQLAPTDEAVSVAVGSKSIRVAVGGMVMTSKLVDGRYPEYGRVIPRELGKVARVGNEALKRALARTSILSNEKYRGVRLAFEEGVLRLQAHNPEQEEAEEEIELDYGGESVAIGFNVAYLSDVLGAVEGSEVEVRFSDAGSSSVWRGVGAEDETYVVMPMRL